MQNEILEALESNKFVSLSFTMNGSNIQVCGTARSNKGVTSPPINLIVAPEELDDSLVKLLQGMWCNARRAERNAKVPEAEAKPEEKPEETAAEEKPEEAVPEAEVKPEEAVPEAEVKPEVSEEAAAEVKAEVKPEVSEEAAAEVKAEEEERIGAELDEWE